MTEFKTLTKACGLSLIGAASILGVSKDTAYSYASGRLDCPNKHTLKLKQLRKAQKRIFNHDTN